MFRVEQATRFPDDELTLMLSTHLRNRSQALITCRGGSHELWEQAMEWQRYEDSPNANTLAWHGKRENYKQPAITVGSRNV
jgi:hypothetical protein